MKSRSYILNELRELNSSLPVDLKEPVFSLPESYFENFPQAVLAKIKSETSAADELKELSPLLSGISKKMPFSLPENYFEQLREEASLVTAEEVLPSFLQNTRTMPYQVPQNYFEGLPGMVLNKVQKPQAKIISINRSQRWMRMAVAAMVAGIMAIGGFLYWNNNSQPPITEEAWVQKNLKGVSTKALDEFIETTDYKQNTDQHTASNKEVRKLLKDVSNKELDAFLSQVPADDELLVIN